MTRRRRAFDARSTLYPAIAEWLDRHDPTGFLADVKAPGVALPV